MEIEENPVKFFIVRYEIGKLRSRNLRQDVGCWMLDVGCWMLDVGCWMLDVGIYFFDSCERMTDWTKLFNFFPRIVRRL
jgi:hypothetical protein